MSTNPYSKLTTMHRYYILPHYTDQHRNQDNLYNPTTTHCHHCHTILPTGCAVCLAVLVRHGNGVEQHQVSMAGRNTQEQAAKMSQLAGQALQAWKVEGHPGWSVDTMDSHHLCKLDLQQV